MDRKVSAIASMRYFDITPACDATDILVKPFDLQEVLQKIEKALPRVSME